MRKLCFAGLACATALLVVSACRPESRVTRVIDGDTFVLSSGEHVRLWGIDAPELSTVAGQQSKRAATALFLGVQVNCTPVGRSYDRVVAQCHDEYGSDVAALLVAIGAAQDVPRYSKGHYAQ